MSTIDDEFSFINKITPKLQNQSNLVIGIGDDAALYTGDSKVEEIICMDTMVEEVHFTKQTMDPFHIGYKALASNISDIAAMGGTPTFYLVSIAIPKTWSEEELLGIYEGMQTLAERYKMDLIGGDTVSSKGNLVITITVLGRVKKGKHLLRSNAKAGDIVFVTGNLGDSAAGLHLLLQKEKATDYSLTERDQALIQKHQLPEPRVDIGNILATYPRVALNDISDGIASELNEIAEASDVTIIIDSEKLPKSEALHHFSAKKQLQWMLNGGEDYELVGTISNDTWPELEKECRMKGHKITKIGFVKEAGKAQVLLKQQETYTMVAKQGYNHFK